MALRAPAVVATSSTCTLRSRLPRNGSLRLLRGYATVRDDERFPPWPRAAHPSPYEILGIEKHAEYNKRAYYRLAKLYHPDSNASHSHSHHSIPNNIENDNHLSPPHTNASIRLERYRLLVAAHELLSDPDKRRLYDTTGLGWSSHAHGSGPSLREMDRHWRSRPGSAANNATWEDWERWHAAREGRAAGRGPEPAYMSHGMFAAMVVGLCMVGWMAQMSRAESAGEEYMAWMAEQNARIGRGLARDGTEAMGRTRGERVDHFLRDRENTLYGYEPARLEREKRE